MKISKLRKKLKDKKFLIKTKDKIFDEMYKLHYSKFYRNLFHYANPNFNIYTKISKLRRKLLFLNKNIRNLETINKLKNDDNSAG